MSSQITLTANTTITYDGSIFNVEGDNTDYSGPLEILRDINVSDHITISLNYTAPISDNDHYLKINLNNITIDGQKSQISIDSTNYPGLFSFIVLSHYNIRINNINIKATSGITLQDSCGWLCDGNGFSNGAINNCSVFGDIGSNNGGLIGDGSVSCTANNCFFSGKIDTNSGGIFGVNSLYCVANNCYSTGNITGSSGGIFGLNADHCTANFCYSIGQIGKSSDYNNGGIFGETSQYCNANFCFSMGNIYGDNDGGNGGIYSTIQSSAEATNCFSVGNIGPNAGGIYKGCLYGTATNCYSIGNIGHDAGGIFGYSTAQSTALNCYSHGNVGDNGGGIFGSNSDNITANYCYNIGTIGSNAGGISGNNCTNVIFQNCYILATWLYGLFDGTNSLSNCISDEGTWNDTNAKATLTNYESEWIVTDQDIPFLLSSYVDCRFAVPYGYETLIYLNNITTITESGTTQLIFIDGFYSTSSMSLMPGLYGYNIINKSVTAQVSSGGVPPFFIKLMDNELNFNPEWFD
jgi:hypothetical protein